MTTPRLMSGGLAIGLLAVTITGCSSSSTVDAEQLIGTWTGTNAGYEGTDPVYVDKPLTLVIQEANGPAFAGIKEWTEPDGTVNGENIIGTVTENGLVTIVDGDGFFEGEFSDATLTGVYVETGEDAAVLTVELSR